MTGSTKIGRKALKVTGKVTWAYMIAMILHCSECHVIMIAPRKGADTPKLYQNQAKRCHYLFDICPCRHFGNAS